MNTSTASTYLNDLSEPPSREPSAELHRYQDVVALFDAAFKESENTRLIKGEGEPEYIPANDQCDFHQVIFAHGYYASALHEIAHWCIAGKARRLLNDYGYWYCPDGRNEAEQKAFEKVEVKPQAIEWAFSVAANKRFRVSTDNLNGEQGDTQAFTLEVHQQVLRYLRDGFPPRAALFIDALTEFYGTAALNIEQFRLPNEWSNSQSEDLL
ncbi:elongation factor P hydroxylase [Paraglaciecola chathamensis]|jgi:elongation factor P hydroxylase|uniref:Elongation factor P hydroxylase n=2 Tax=Paraglaciecola chathamensis TaxID=368405 RepID=A0ABQ0I2Y8_9ALTE|nr:MULTISPECIES: elongation factor P hydroxylase [Paraglaciecola]AEE21927.1 protein of unknown function DUF462 [Glaciecola sp. 4H-3-7+YE-5]GAC03672.1 hypothetical protein GAGA_0809 [Paraglaciecola agarilytica NO2]GAC10381.1 hypothetical protein GCHA_2434 [Paraglaciecola chathamensis S18K6]